VTTGARPARNPLALGMAPEGGRISPEPRNAPVLRAYEEIEIRGYLTYADADPEGRAIVRRNLDRQLTPSDTLVQAETVARALEEAAMEGVRAVVMTIESRGGIGGAACVIGDAIRKFSRAGGTVVAYVPRFAASAACEIAVQADYVVIEPAAAYFIHAACHSVDAFPDAAWRKRANVRQLATYAARTATPRAMLDAWIDATDDDGRTVARMSSLAAMAHGWADTVGDRAEAQRLACAAAEGHRVVTPRSSMLSLRSAGREREAGSLFGDDPWTHPVTLRTRGANGIRELGPFTVARAGADLSLTVPCTISTDLLADGAVVGPKLAGGAGRSHLSAYAAVRAAGGFNVNAALSYSHNIASVTFEALPSAPSNMGLKILFTTPIPFDSTPIVTRGAFSGNTTALTMHPYFADYIANGSGSLDGFRIGFTNGAGTIINANNGYAQVFYAMLGGW
jgi:ATP-dependent protease ClpP protease subunit